MKTLNLGASRSSNDCWMKLFYEQQGLRGPLKIAQAMGTRMETGVQVPVTEKMTGITAVTIEDAMKQSTESLVVQLPKGEDRDKFRNSLDEEIEAVKRYVPYIDYTPLRLSERFTFSIEGAKRKVHGEKDLVAQRGAYRLVVDFKRKPKKVWKPQKSWVSQLALYAMHEMKVNGTSEVPVCENHVLIPGKDPQIITVSIGAIEMYDALERQYQLDQALNKQNFPMNRYSNLCSKEWCDYWEICHQDHAMSVPEVMETISVS